jgi:PEP-CTERM motif
MKRTNFLTLTCGAILLTAACAQAQTIFANWNFDNTTSFPQTEVINSPAPVIGVGTATVLGMDNSYNNATSVADADVTATAGASTGATSAAWRIRGGDGTYAGAGSPNGWSSQAPIATQGAEFATSTASDINSANINISFDLYTTTQAEANLAVLYTLDDGVADPLWQLASIISAGSTGNLEVNSSSSYTVSGNYVQLTQTKGWDNGITATIAGAGGNANFAVEIVNASTGTDDVNIGGSPYNNTSGNWRFDNVEISAVPEPSSLAFAGLGLMGLIAVRRRSRKS